MIKKKYNKYFIYSDTNMVTTNPITQADSGIVLLTEKSNQFHFTGEKVSLRQLMGVRNDNDPMGRFGGPPVSDYSVGSSSDIIKLYKK